MRYHRWNSKDNSVTVDLTAHEVSVIVQCLRIVRESTTEIQVEGAESDEEVQETISALRETVENVIRAFNPIVHQAFMDALKFWHPEQFN